jgi:death-on-curing protein
MNYLTADNILDLHTIAVERFGGRLGIKSQDKLQSVVTAPQQVFFGAELYTDLASKAAVMGFQMLKNRPFLAGNEATALLAVLRFLYINDVALGTVFAEELADKLQAVLRSHLDRDGLTEWLRERLEISVAD